MNENKVSNEGNVDVYKKIVTDICLCKKSENINDDMVILCLMLSCTYQAGF